MAWAEYRWKCPSCGAGQGLADHDRREFDERKCCGRSIDDWHVPAVMTLTVTPLQPVPSVETIDRAYERAHRKAVDHLDGLDKDLFNGESSARPTTTPAAPYCACETCIVREVLHAAKTEILLIVRGEQ